MNKEDRTVYNILWETDQNDPDKDDYFLPSFVTLPEEIVQDAILNGADVIGDYLSDRFGFLHSGFALSEELQRQIDGKEPEI